MLFVPPPAAAQGRAQVRLVDHFHGGRVEVKVNDDIDRKLGYGDRTRFLSVKPETSGYDGIYVTWLKYPTCGNEDGRDFFDAGQSPRFKVVKID